MQKIISKIKKPNTAFSLFASNYINFLSQEKVLLKENWSFSNNLFNAFLQINNLDTSDVIPKKIEGKRSTPMNFINNISENIPQKKLNHMLNEEIKMNEISEINELTELNEIIPLSRGRYSNEFIQEQKLGSGGFGSVYKVFCKLDGEKYAIKKIKIRIKNKSHSEITFNSLPIKVAFFHSS